jgi:hypothetical protein
MHPIEIIKGAVLIVVFSHQLLITLFRLLPESRDNINQKKIIHQNTDQLTWKGGETRKKT